MTGQELLAISHLVVLGAAAVLLVGLLAFYRNHALTAGIALSALAAALVLMFTVVPRQATSVTPLLLIDGQATLFGAMVIAAAFFCATLAAGKTKGEERGAKDERNYKERNEEFYILLLLATLGAAAMTASVHLVSFFLSLELLSVSLYSMIAYERSALGVEAGIKYLVLAGTSSAILLFGLAVIYAFAGYDNNPGTMNIAKLGSFFASADNIFGTGQYLKHFTPMLAGLALVLTGVGFKLALVPFHLWTADVYQGSPAPAAAFVATASKGAALAFLLRLAGDLGLQTNLALNLALFLAAIASMIAGNVLALWQHNLKRVLAYSSIAHMGYVLVALLAGGADAATAAAFYLAAYFVTILGAFGVVSVLEGQSDDNRCEEYRGLFFRRPAMAVILALMMLSLAGLPLTAGFMGKLLVLKAGLAAGQWALAVVLIASSGVGLCYYLRIALAVFQREQSPATAASNAQTPLADPLTAWTMTGLLLAIGVLPEPLLRWISWLLHHE